MSVPAERQDVTVYGASDDLIEVEGGVEVEFYCDGGGVVLLVSATGAVVEVAVSLEEWWSARARIRRPGPRGQEVTVTQVKRPGTDEDDGDMAMTVSGLVKPLVYKVENAS